MRSETFGRSKDRYTQQVRAADVMEICNTPAARIYFIADCGFGVKQIRSDVCYFV